MRPTLNHLYERYVRPRDDLDNFPSKQLFVLAICRICEPIAFMSIFPYAYKMIQHFQLTDNEAQISMYAGLLITAFAFAEFSTGVVWGRISDKFGRKPVLIMGLVGTALSMISFGLSTSIQGAILARALGGLLNGNVGVLQTTVAELVTKKEHQPRAYSIMPFVWCLGSIIGPALGGALAMPCEAYPWLFSRGSIWDKHPFLLPNLVCVIILLLGITNGFLFLEETHTDLRHKEDTGRKCGNALIAWIFGTEKKSASAKEIKAFDVYRTLSVDPPPPGYKSTENSPRLCSTPAPSMKSDVEVAGSEKEDRGVVKTFNKQVVLIIIGYGILAYHSVSFDSLMPVFLSEARPRSPASLPFKFTGGFDMSTKAIGFMLAVQGIYSMIAQLWLFPFIVRRIGTLAAFRSVMFIWPLLYFFVPYLVLLPEKLQTAGVYFALLAKITFHVIAFPSNAILLTNAAHSKNVLGTINGVAASTACLARSFGPTLTGSIHAYGLRLGYNGLGWWAGGLVCAIGAAQSLFMEEVEGRMDRPNNEEERALCEPLITQDVEPEETKPPRNSIASIDELDLDLDVLLEPTKA